MPVSKSKAIRQKRRKSTWPTGSILAGPTEEMVFADSVSWPVKAGGQLDRNILDNQRALIAERMRNNGYFAFTKEFISFFADTVAGSKEVDLTMVIHNPKQKADDDAAKTPLMQMPRHRRYVYNKVTVVTDPSSPPKLQHNKHRPHLRGSEPPICSALRQHTYPPRRLDGRSGAA